jgi:type II secretory pathway pseudopilin PulG
VVLIIGLLAAIALPNFIGQRNKGKDASAKSLARNMVRQLQRAGHRRLPGRQHLVSVDFSLQA